MDDGNKRYHFRASYEKEPFPGRTGPEGSGHPTGGVPLGDRTTYLGNQLESEFGGDRCFGVLANMDFILICTYGKDGANPELVLYKKR